MDLYDYMYDICNNSFSFDVDNTLKRSLHRKGCSRIVGLDNGK